MDEYMFWLIYFTLCKRYLPSQEQQSQDAETAAVAAAGAAAAAAAAAAAGDAAGDTSSVSEQATSRSAAGSSPGAAGSSPPAQADRGKTIATHYSLAYSGVWFGCVLMLCVGCSGNAVLPVLPDMASQKAMRPPAPTLLISSFTWRLHAMRPGCPTLGKTSTRVHMYCAPAGGSTSQAGASSAAAAATAGSDGVGGQDDLAELADDPELTAYLQVGAAVQ
jgi:hypothetical protein